MATASDRGRAVAGSAQLTQSAEDCHTAAFAGPGRCDATRVVHDESTRATRERRPTCGQALLGTGVRAYARRAAPATTTSRAARGDRVHTPPSWCAARPALWLPSVSGVQLRATGTVTESAGREAIRDWRRPRRSEALVVVRPRLLLLARSPIVPSQLIEPAVEVRRQLTGIRCRDLDRRFLTDVDETDDASAELAILVPRPHHEDPDSRQVTHRRDGGVLSSSDRLRR